MCDHVVKLRREAPTFHVWEKLFKANVNLQFEVQECLEKDVSKVIQFSIYGLNPKVRVWGTTAFFRKHTLVYSRGWQCVDLNYFEAVKHFVYMCAKFKDANEIIQNIGVNYGIIASYKTTCDFMLFYTATQC